MRRFFFTPEPSDKGLAKIIGREAHHIHKVLRLKIGDIIIVFDGHGAEYKARIKAFKGNGVHIELVAPLMNRAESGLNLVVAQGVLKDKKMDPLVRHLTELGVQRWIPFIAKRSVPVLNEHRSQNRGERWQKISLEAVKQCRRSRPMSIEKVMTFQETLNASEPFGLKLIFWEQEEVLLPSALSAHVAEKGIFAMIGPEGGFHEAEVHAAREKGFLCLGLGPRILRAETAALTVCAILQYVFGDLR
jgi:16S rRNA (uracil1498-N3)-methyltransferase